VELSAQQGVVLGAAIDTPGALTITSTLGEVDVLALLRTANGSTMSLEAGNGVYQSDLDLGRIVSEDLRVLNTGAAGGTSDIQLTANNNAFSDLGARNLAAGGDVIVQNREQVRGHRDHRDSLRRLGGWRLDGTSRRYHDHRGGQCATW